MTRRAVLRGGAALGGAALGGCLPESGRMLIFGTAETEGVYFQVGNAVALLVNRDHRRHGVRCLPQSMPGSSANLRALLTGAVHLGLVQGNDVWAVAPAERPRLRLLAALHVESLILLAGPQIASLDELPGRRVALGPVGSGHRTAMTALMTARGWAPERFAAIDSGTVRSSLAALCAGQLDAVPLMIGHPVAAVADAMTRCGLHPLPLTDADRAAFGRERGFRQAAIPAGTYGTGSPELATVGARVELACTADFPDDLAALVVRTVLGDLDTLRRAHPVLGDLTAAALRPPADSPVALHAAAARVYDEAGVA
ncbi:TAXI family TRAP transporter solute-binding subunit [Azospirillum sp. A39]|uniref:TAXI family TRAP transporter solute-binding subunit n=1 Tax=Azospirillum sp. A39 TaxID=3462279 RepID=UPI00404556FE